MAALLHSSANSCRQELITATKPQIITASAIQNPARTNPTKSHPQSPQPMQGAARRKRKRIDRAK
jgi:hypothetical protein